MGVWAVNYATEADWECMRDDPGGMEELAAVVCLPQLFATEKEALDEGEKAWRSDQDEDDLEERNRIAGLRADDTPGERRLICTIQPETVEVVICARELKLPDVYEG